MAEFKQLQTKNKKDDLWLLSGISYAYVRMARPKMNDNKGVDCYSTAIICDEDTLDELDEIVTKPIVRKKCKTSLFKEKFGFEPPFPNEKNQYWINLNSQANDKSGKPYELWMDLRPTVELITTDDKGNRKATDITLEGNIGNGSKGNIVLTRFTSKGHGQFFGMRKLYVTDHIVYESSGSYDPIAEAMGIDHVETYTNEELAAKGITQNKVSEEEKQAESDLAKSSPSAKKEPEPEPELPEELPDVDDDDDFDSDVPF